jgi:hypothetical protein
MARPRNWTWTVIISLLVGIAAATVFWLYTPYGHDQLAQQVAEDLKSQPFPPGAKGGALHLKKLASQVAGSRFQMVADGKEIFMVDLKTGRVWRYFHETKEAGVGREDEGFLPVPFYYAGQKHYTASEIEPPPSNPGNPATPAPPGKQPQ